MTPPDPTRRPQARGPAPGGRPPGAPRGAGPGARPPGAPRLFFSFFPGGPIPPDPPWERPSRPDLPGPGLAAPSCPPGRAAARKTGGTRPGPFSRKNPARAPASAAQTAPAPPSHPARQPGPQARRRLARDHLRADHVRRAPGPATGPSGRPLPHAGLETAGPDDPPARGARQHHRGERGSARHDGGDLPGVRRPAADAGGRSGAGRDQARLLHQPARPIRSSNSSSTPPRRSTWCWPRAYPRRWATRSRP